MGRTTSSLDARGRAPRARHLAPRARAFRRRRSKTRTCPSPRAPAGEKMLEVGASPRDGSPSVSPGWAPPSPRAGVAAPALHPSTESGDDEPYVCYFVEKRAMMRTGVGTLWNPPGRSRRRDPPPPISSETGRPVAPGGLDDSVLDDRCASHGCVTLHLADLLARDPSRDPNDVSAFVHDRACVRVSPREGDDGDDASASSSAPSASSSASSARSYRPARANPLPLAELAARALGDALRCSPQPPRRRPARRRQTSRSDARFSTGGSWRRRCRGRHETSTSTFGISSYSTSPSRGDVGSRA